jgi:hypothetical protein
VIVHTVPNSAEDNEAALADKLHAAVLSRPWDYWKRRITA